MTATLLAAGLTSILTGIAFEAVGLRIRRSPVSPVSALARKAHVTWWGCLGTYLILQGGLTLAAAWGALDPDTYLASRALAIPLLCTAVWGLSTYLLFLFTGSPQVARVLLLLYTATGAVFLYATFVEQPSMQVQPWLVGYDDASPLYRLVYLLVGMPPIVASIAYLSLLRRTREPLQRYRTLLTGTSILLYVASGLLARISAHDIIVFLTLIPLGLLAATAAVAAQFPPAGLRRRLERAQPPLARRQKAKPRAEEYDSELAMRLRELL